LKRRVASDAAILIERLRADQWQRLKDIRIRALADAPDAFGTTLAEAFAWPDSRWQEQCRTITTFIAVLDGRDVGMVRGVGSRENVGDAFLISMWVEPVVRRRGVAGQLIDQVIAWAKASGFSRLMLDVADTNRAAIARYASKGFVPNGQTGALPSPRDHVREHRRELRLQGVQAAVPAVVVSVSSSSGHTFSKAVQPHIRLIAGLGVEGDAHCGETIKHRSRVAVDPTQPNLRQVHLLQEDVLIDLRSRGFDVRPGSIGENIVTSGIDLLSLPRDTELALGAAAVVRLTGLRSPCAQLDAFQTGLMTAVLDRDEAGQLVRKSGVMAVVIAGGIVGPGDPIGIRLPAGPPVKLDRV
jgi:GNAT superfamily N-acetyltransferase